MDKSSLRWRGYLSFGHSGEGWMGRGGVGVLISACAGGSPDTRRL